MSKTRVIYSAYDLETNHQVVLNYQPSNVGSWHTFSDNDDDARARHYVLIHDWLPNAAHRITQAIKMFRDDDAPTPLQALEAIVKAIGDDHYTVEEDNDGPYILDWYEIEAELGEDA